MINQEAVALAMDIASFYHSTDEMKNMPSKSMKVEFKNELEFEKERQRLLRELETRQEKIFTLMKLVGSMQLGTLYVRMASATLREKYDEAEIHKQRILEFNENNKE